MMKNQNLQNSENDPRRINQQQNQQNQLSSRSLFDFKIQPPRIPPQELPSSTSFSTNTAPSFHQSNPQSVVKLRCSADGEQNRIIQSPFNNSKIIDSTKLSHTSPPRSLVGLKITMQVPGGTDSIMVDNTDSIIPQAISFCQKHNFQDSCVPILIDQINQQLVNLNASHTTSPQLSIYESTGIALSDLYNKKQQELKSYYYADPQSAKQAKQQPTQLQQTNVAQNQQSTESKRKQTKKWSRNTSSSPVKAHQVQVPDQIATPTDKQAKGWRETSQTRMKDLREQVKLSKAESSANLNKEQESRINNLFEMGLSVSKTQRSISNISVPTRTLSKSRFSPKEKSLKEMVPEINQVNFFNNCDSQSSKIITTNQQSQLASIQEKVFTPKCSTKDIQMGIRNASITPSPGRNRFQGASDNYTRSTIARTNKLNEKKKENVTERSKSPINTQQSQKNKNQFGIQSDSNTKKSVEQQKMQRGTADRNSRSKTPNGQINQKIVSRDVSIKEKSDKLSNSQKIPNQLQSTPREGCNQKKFQPVISENSKKLAEDQRLKTFGTSNKEGIHERLYNQSKKESKQKDVSEIKIKENSQQILQQAQLKEVQKQLIVEPQQNQQQQQLLSQYQQQKQPQKQQLLEQQPQQQQQQQQQLQQSHQNKIGQNSIQLKEVPEQKQRVAYFKLSSIHNKQSGNQHNKLMQAHNSEDLSIQRPRFINPLSLQNKNHDDLVEKQRQLLNYYENNHYQEDTKMDLRSQSSPVQNIYLNTEEQTQNTFSKSSNYRIQENQMEYNQPHTQSETQLFHNEFNLESNPQKPQFNQFQDSNDWIQSTQRRGFSSHEYNYNRKKALNYVFLALDSDEDGFISSEKIDLSRVNTDILIMIQDVLINIEQLNIEVDFEMFCQLSENNNISQSLVEYIYNQTILAGGN